MNTDEWPKRLVRGWSNPRELPHLGLTADSQTWEVTLSLPRGLDGSNSPAARHLTFEELDQAREELGKLIEEFEQLDGKWIVDADIRF